MVLFDRVKKIFSDKQEIDLNSTDQCFFRNLDCLETTHGDFWTVIGNVHPKDKVISFIKYKRSGQVKQGEESRWVMNGIEYDRVLPHYSVSQVVKTFDALAADYIFFDERTGINMSCVPHTRIKRHYIPSLGLKEIQVSDPKDLDPLQVKFLELVETISTLAHVPIEKFGVTGSILLGLQNPDFSDIDLVVNGLNASSKVRELFLRGFDELNFSKVDEKTVENIVNRKVEIFDIPKESSALFVQRRWNYGIFQQTRFSIHPVQERSSFNYDDTTFSSIGEAKVLAEIKDTEEALFYPPKWRIEIKEVLDSTKAAKRFSKDITELVSYEGFYLDVLKLDEKVEITGKVEKVESVHEEDYYRILVGGVGEPSKISIHSNPEEEN